MTASGGAGAAQAPRAGHHRRRRECHWPGALATIGVQKPKNLTVAAIDNQRYGETGMQATHTASGVNLADNCEGLWIQK